MKKNWRKISLILLDTLLAVYLLLAITAFNTPKDSGQTCEEVVINISDENTNGFLSPNEIKQILIDKGLYPKTKPMSMINPRQIEDLLKVTPFVNTAQCYKTEGGQVHIDITQRTPLIRIKSANGNDYYIDDKGGIMPNSKYTSDLIIATGNISKSYAQNYITPLALYIMQDDLWRNQIEQINILPDLSVELVPRVGDHIVLLGYLPKSADKQRRNKEIDEFLAFKLKRLEKFYKYGLSQIGWNRYNYINMEFDNQIICKRNAEFDSDEHQPKTQIYNEADSVSKDSTINQTKTPADNQQNGQKQQKTI